MAICPHCTKLIDDGETKCPYCGNDPAEQPYEPEMAGGHKGLSWFAVIAAAVVVYLLVDKPTPEARDPQFVSVVSGLEMVVGLGVALLLLSARGSSWGNAIKVVAAGLLCLLLLGLKACAMFGTSGRQGG